MTTTSDATIGSNAGGMGEGDQPGTGDDLAGRARSAAEAGANTLAGAADAVGARLPEAAATTRAAVDEAARRLATGSDASLTVGTAFTFGVALGLLIGGANRILATIVLVAAAAMGLTLLDRTSNRSPGPEA